MNTTWKTKIHAITYEEYSKESLLEVRKKRLIQEPARISSKVYKTLEKLPSEGKYQEFVNARKRKVLSWWKKKTWENNSIWLWDLISKFRKKEILNRTIPIEWHPFAQIIKLYFKHKKASTSKIFPENKSQSKFKEIVKNWPGNNSPSSSTKTTKKEKPIVIESGKSFQELLELMKKSPSENSQYINELFIRLVRKEIWIYKIETREEITELFVFALSVWRLPTASFETIRTLYQVKKRFYEVMKPLIKEWINQNHEEKSELVIEIQDIGEERVAELEKSNNFEQANKEILNKKLKALEQRLKNKEDLLKELASRLTLLQIDRYISHCNEQVNKDGFPKWSKVTPYKISEFVKTLSYYHRRWAKDRTGIEGKSKNHDKFNDILQNFYITSTAKMYFSELRDFTKSFMDYLFNNYKLNDYRFYAIVSQYYAEELQFINVTKRAVKLAPEYVNLIQAEWVDFFYKHVLDIWNWSWSEAEIRILRNAILFLWTLNWKSENISEMKKILWSSSVPSVRDIYIEKFVKKKENVPKPEQKPTQ